MATLRVNSTDLPEPQSISVSLQDVDYESGRDQTGTMFRDRKRGGASAVRKIECKWGDAGLMGSWKIHSISLLGEVFPPWIQYLTKCSLTLPC